MEAKFKKQFTEISEESKLVGANYVIVNGDAISEQGFYGYQDLEKQIKTTDKTIYRIASISKIVVGMGVMRLVEEGKLDIYDDIQDILGFPIRNPKYPDSPITIKMLLTHTSSITDGYDDEDPANDDKIVGYNGVNGTSKPVTLADILVPNKSKYWTDLTYSKYKPGEYFIYSNFGTGILTCIIEKITHEYFTDWIKKTILDKLDMDASFNPRDIKGIEYGSSIYKRDLVNDDYKLSRTFASFVERFYPKFPLGENYRGPAGGLFTSMEDLAKILIVLLNEGKYKDIRILKKETVEFMSQFHWFGNPEDSSYKAKGLSLKLTTDYGPRILRGHTGSAYGVISCMFYSLEQKVGICFITNGGHITYNIDNKADLLTEILKEFTKTFICNEKKHTFVIDLLGKESKLDERTIYMPTKVVKECCEYYVPALTIAEGLLEIPRITENYIEIEKNKISQILSLWGGAIKEVDGFLLLPIKKVLNNLRLEYQIDENKIVITY